MRERIPDKLRNEVAGMLLGTWWVQCLLATEEGKLGMILRAAFAKPTLNPPWYGPSAIIDDKGIVLTNYVDSQNHMHFAEPICSIDELLGNLRRLCDALKLSDTDAYALFEMVKQWVKSDARPETEQPEDRIPIEYRTKH